ncbi:MAG TPA: glycosyltransferase family 4 protein [Bacteroidales bacterium]|nr:glycosyltransferase family 4 protein [Bacteroidales bacterium]
MRILQICNKPPYPPRDGGSIAMFSLLRSLHGLGHEMTLLTMCTPKHRMTHAENTALAKIAHLHTVEVDTTVKLPYLVFNFVFSGKPYNAVRFISADFEKILAGILTGGSFDVVQLEGLYLAPYISTIRRYTTALVVLRAHNVEHEIWSRIAHTEPNLLKKFYFRLLARRIRRFESSTMNRYDLLVPITPRDLDLFSRLGNTCPAQVCPAGIDINPIGTTPVLDEQSLFFLGSMDWIPNQEGLLWFVSAVFPDLKRRIPGLTLHIAGRNAPLWLAGRLTGPGIAFHGEIADAHGFMLAHGILVAPYFSGGGMRVKIAEAMSLGIPVVTTPMGAEGIEVINGENVVIANTAEEFLVQLERLVKYPDFCLNIGNSARDFVQQRLDNQKLAVSLTGFYNKYLRCS